MASQIIDDTLKPHDNNTSSPRSLYATSGSYPLSLPEVHR